MHNNLVPNDLDQVFQAMLSDCTESTKARLLAAAEQWRQEQAQRGNSCSPLESASDEKPKRAEESSTNDAAIDPFATQLPTSDPTYQDGLIAGGRFRILRKHAEGGLGCVLIASDEELQRKVAVKEIRTKYASNETFRDRFLLEAKVTGNLEHPGVVPVYGLGTFPDGRPYYAMRFIQGETLKAAIEKLHAIQGDDGLRNLELRKLLGRFSHVCETLAYAHNRQVVHRDIKPDNIMLGDYGETLVVDWGLAKMLDHRNDAAKAANSVSPIVAHGSITDATQAGDLVGSVGYMSPEQAWGRIDLLSPASDVYGLGATLYHLLTGKSSIPDGPLKEMVDQVRLGDFLRPRQVNRSIPAALEAICLKAMGKDPQSRYSSAKELAEELERWLADEPVRCYRESVLERAARFARRHRGWTQSLAVALAVITLGSIIATILINRALHREAMARQRADQAGTFVRNLFRGSNPIGFNSGDELGFGIRETDGPELKAKDLVDRGAERIRAELKEQPLLASQLLDTIGSVYADLGLFNEAVNCFRDSLARKSKVLPPDDPSFAVTNARLAWSLHSGGQLHDAKEVYGQALDAQLRSKEPHAVVDATATMLRLGLLETEQGELKEAEKWLDRAIRMRRDKLGNDSQAVAIAKIYEAALKFVKEDFDGGNGSVTEAWLILEKLHDRQVGPAKAVSLFQSGLGLLESGNYAVAESEIRKAHELAAEVLGPNHPYSAWALAAHGETLMRLGRHAEAEQQLLHSQAIIIRFVKPNHLHLCNLRVLLAEVYLNTNHPQECEQLLRENLERLRTFHATNTADIATAECLLGKTLRIRSELIECEEVYGTALQRTHGDNRLTQVHALSLIGLGECALQGGNVEAARKHFEDSLTIMQGNPARFEAMIASTSVDLGEALLRAEETADAEKALATAWGTLKNSKRTTVRWRAASLYGRCLFLRSPSQESEKLLLSAYKAAGDDHAFDPKRWQDPRNAAWGTEAAKWLIEYYESQNKTTDADKVRAETATLTKSNDEAQPNLHSTEADIP